MPFRLRLGLAMKAAMLEILALAISILQQYNRSLDPILLLKAKKDNKLQTKSYPKFDQMM
jgi:hypothetical protein